MDYSKLSEAELKGKARGAMMTRYGIAGAGFVAGLIFANQRGTKFWGYVGYGLLGSMIGGTAGYFIAAPKVNAVVTELEKRAEEEN